MEETENQEEEKNLKEIFQSGNPETSKMLAKEEDFEIGKISRGKRRRRKRRKRRKRRR